MAVNRQAAAQHTKVVSWLLTGRYDCPEWFCRASGLLDGMAGP